MDVGEDAGVLQQPNLLGALDGVGLAVDPQLAVYILEVEAHGVEAEI